MPLAALLAGPTRCIEIPLGLLVSLMIVGMLWMFSTRLGNLAAIVNKEPSWCDFFGSHIGRLNATRRYWLQQLAQETTGCLTQSLFWDQWFEPVTTVLRRLYPSAGLVLLLQNLDSFVSRLGEFWCNLWDQCSSGWWSKSSAQIRSIGVVCNTGNDDVRGIFDIIIMYSFSIHLKNDISMLSKHHTQ